jgi:hypothetical protein
VGELAPSSLGIIFEFGSKFYKYTYEAVGSLHLQIGDVSIRLQSFGADLLASKASLNPFLKMQAPPQTWNRTQRLFQIKQIVQTETFFTTYI